VATLLRPERTDAIAAATFAPPDEAGVSRRVGRLDHDNPRPAAESYPILLVPPDDVRAPSRNVALATDGDLAVNVVVPPMLEPLLSRMRTQSQTFRRQCARLRGEPRLLVRVYTGAAGLHPSGRATTQIQRGRTGLEADVYLAVLDAAGDRIELIAHEFEHVIEQLDGLDLPRLARLSPATVWAIGDGSFETQRATHRGRVVAAEVGDRAE
jgi:hypothetical protein